MRHKFSLSLSLALILAMLVTSVGLADTIQSDGDTVTGNQTIINLGNVAPGAVLSPMVSFRLVCDGNKHVDSGQTVTLSYFAGGSTMPVGGSLSATDGAIGPVGASWPDDTTGPSNCGSVSPLISSTDSSVSITAPTVGGSYSFVVAYKASISPTGSNDPSSITGSVPTVTYTFTVVTNTAPSVIVTGVTDGASYEFGSGPAATCQVTDAEDGNSSFAATLSAISGSLAAYGLGEQTASCEYADNGGLTASASATYTIVDTTAPQFSCDTPDGLWHASDISIGCTASDNVALANPADASFSLVTNVSAEAEDANATTNSHDIYDVAGNHVTAGPISGNMVDKKAPQLVGCDSPDGFWYGSDVTLSCSYSDGGSGPATQSVSLATNVSGGTETNNALASAGGVQACDSVGNCAASPADIGGNKVDKKAPTNITFVGGVSAGGVYYFGFVPGEPTCTATDGGSGLKYCEVTGYSSYIGTHTLTATAKDNVDNSEAASLSYEVKVWTLSGFYQPVDMNGVWNTVKGGSTVPLKFEIFAGATELKLTSYVTGFSAQAVTCPNGNVTTDPIEVLATGGTSLRFDTTGDQFVYNWQTPKKPGACYKVTMTTLDSSPLTANFILK